MRAVQELLENDADRRVQFYELIIYVIDGNQISPEWVLFSDEATFAQNLHWIRKTQ